MSSDTARSRSFYTELFGWTAEEPNEQFGGYFQFFFNGTPVGGGMSSQTANMGDSNFWSIYLATDDATKTVEAAATNGGQVTVPPMAVADLGTMGVVQDPSGAAIGLWQPGVFNGFGTYGENNTPAWFELHTRDYQAAIDFYRNVFRWDTQTAGDTPEFRYTVLKVGEEMLAGIMDAAAFLPEGMPSHWMVYFGVEDTDAAVAKAQGLGGTILEKAVDTPYGRMATIADPNGAVFKVVHGPSAQ
jgi:hypothetical protein